MNLEKIGHKGIFNLTRKEIDLSSPLEFEWGKNATLTYRKATEGLELILLPKLCALYVKDLINVGFFAGTLRICRLSTSKWSVRLKNRMSCKLAFTM